MSKRWHAVEGQAVIGGEMHVGSTHKLYSRCIRTEEDKMVALKVGAGLGEERGLHWIAAYHWVQMWH
jgi:hypothetical protein